jgi:hypothetical protein
VFHAGIKGSFMDNKTHQKYFARIATNQDATFRWTNRPGEGSSAVVLVAFAVNT